MDEKFRSSARAKAHTWRSQFFAEPGHADHRVAYYAPGARAQIASHVVGLTALHDVEYQVFSDRAKALFWLLAK